SGSSQRLGSAACCSSSRTRADISSGSITFSMVVRVELRSSSAAESSGRITSYSTVLVDARPQPPSPAPPSRRPLPQEADAEPHQRQRTTRAEEEEDEPGPRLPGVVLRERPHTPGQG